jgi:hypothetical protein
MAVPKNMQVGRNKMSFEPTELQRFIIDIFDFHQLHAVERAQKEFLEQWIEPENPEEMLKLCNLLNQEQRDQLADPENTYKGIKDTIPVVLYKWVDDLAFRMF